MKKVFSILLMLAMLLCAFATAETEGLSILVLVPSLGDGSYFAAAAQGAEALAEMYPGTISSTRLHTSPSRFSSL